MRNIILTILVGYLWLTTAYAIDEAELEAFDQAVFGDEANGITPLTHDEMKAYKKQLDEGKLSDKDPAYSKAFEKSFQLSPKEVREIKRYNNRIKEEEARPSRTYRGKTSSDKIDISPGSEIKTIRLAKHYACSVSFLDSTGQPWPISHYTPRSSEDFTVSNPEKHPHILEISSVKEFAQSNMSITFVGLDSPVVIELISGFSEEVDFKKEFHVPLPGPNAIQKTNNLPKVSDSVMLAFLDNVPPPNAKIREAVGADPNTIIWEYNGNLYIRSKAWLHIPAPIMRQKSSDGTRVYKTNKAPSLSMSLEGRPLQVLLKD